MNENSKIDFSIIVLNWNSLVYLKKCLGALRNQSHRAFEVFCIDNGSTDGSTEWINSVNLDELVGVPAKKILLKKNIGFAAGMNKGIRESKGKYIVPLNVDVFLDQLKK